MGTDELTGPVSGETWSLSETTLDELRNRLEDAASIGVGIFVIQTISSGPDDALEDHVTVKIMFHHRVEVSLQPLSLEVLQDRKIRSS